MAEGAGAAGLTAVQQLALADEAKRRLILKLMPRRLRTELEERWAGFQHQGQFEPAGEWRTWLIMAGRGFGKTRTGAEWVSELARGDGSLRIALVGATEDEVRKVMIEGESGLLAVAWTGERVSWVPSNRTVTFASGAQAFVYSGENPEKLRGPEHHYAWCDEIAKWRHAEAAWDNLQMTLRLGGKPRTMVTTTPRPTALMKRLLRDVEIERTGGSTGTNEHLPEAFAAAMVRSYGGTRLGRQELDGELIEDAEGALWKRELIERSRQSGPLPGDLRRVVIGVDPPASAGGDACGIVAVGLGADGIGYVLGDESVRGLSPEGWARAVAAAAETYGADRVVAERNMGGDMVESVLRGAAVNLPVTLVTATRGKAARAEPVAALFEKGRAKFAGAFPALEDELAGLTAGGGYEGLGRSPDRADAMVWALTELMLGKAQPPPRVRAL